MRLPRWVSSIGSRPVRAPSHVIHSGRDLFGTRPNAVYDVLAHLESGLMLDIGAAAGTFTELMLAKSPSSRVIAFEPFVGNHPHFEARIGDDPRVRLIRAAVSDVAGEAQFYVSGTVTGTEKGWESMVGYSSLGFLVDDGRASSIPVSTVTVDDVIRDQAVRFAKVDVQGGEVAVLRSARTAIDSDRVDVVFIEFTGEVDILSFFLQRGWYVMYSDHVVIPKGGVEPAEIEFFQNGILSTGRAFWRGWPKMGDGTAKVYMRMLTDVRKQTVSAWTDLVCVRPGFLETFMGAAARAADVSDDSGPSA